MWLELPPLWIVLLNIVGIPGIHLAVSWIFTRIPRGRFHASHPLFREIRWEDGGAFYQRWFLIRQWKGLLPDAAPWFDGFAKGKLTDKDPNYLRDFIAETCRGEAAHYAQIPALWICLIWNPWPVAAGIIMIYSVISNLPCLLLQRFTRARLRHFLEGLETSSNSTGSGR